MTKPIAYVDSNILGVFVTVLDSEAQGRKAEQITADVGHALEAGLKALHAKAYAVGKVCGPERGEGVYVETVGSVQISEKHGYKLWYSEALNYTRDIRDTVKNTLKVAGYTIRRIP